jgi:hypothetical protein
LILAPRLSCFDCQAFKILSSGWYIFVYFRRPWGSNAITWQFPSEIGVLAWFLVYLLLLGCVQWLVLRRRLKFAICWVFIPAINAITLLISSFLLEVPDIFSLLTLNIPDLLFIPLLLALYLLALGMQDIIAGLVIAKILRANAVDKPELLPPASP